MSDALPFSPSLFAGSRVLVTGAGAGIGQAVARLFLATGATVVAHAGRRAASVEAVFGPGKDADPARTFVTAADFAQAGAAARVVGDAVERMGGLDILVNNAGTMIGRIPLADTAGDAWHQVVDLNARSVVEACAAAVPHLKAGRAPAIVNTVSISARTGGSPGSSLYSAAKAFVATHTRALARELAPAGIRVNAVSPGTIMTDFHRRYSTPEKLEATRATIPMGRLGTAEDCAPAYLFLASAALGGYITGQVIEVNGGQLMA